MFFRKVVLIFFEIIGWLVYNVSSFF